MILPWFVYISMWSTVTVCSDGQFSDSDRNLMVILLCADHTDLDTVCCLMHNCRSLVVGGLEVMKVFINVDVFYLNT